MTNEERFRLAMQAHSEEHAAMREKGLSRPSVIGRPKPGHTFSGARALGVVAKSAVHTPDIVQLTASQLQGLSAIQHVQMPAPQLGQYRGTGTQFGFQQQLQQTWTPTELQDLPWLQETHEEILRAGRGVMQRSGLRGITDQPWFPYAAAGVGVAAIVGILWAAS